MAIARARGAQGFRDPEVGDNGRTTREKNVLRLDVAMHHALRVRVGQCPCDVAQDAERLPDRECGAARQSRAQRFPGHEGHRVVRQRARASRTEHGHDVRLLQPRRQLHFPREALGADAFRQFGRDHLHDHHAAECVLVCDEHARHAAAAEFALEGVAVAEGGLELGAEVGHGSMRDNVVMTSKSRS